MNRLECKICGLLKSTVDGLAPFAPVCLNNGKHEFPSYEDGLETRGLETNEEAWAIVKQMKEKYQKASGMKAADGTAMKIGERLSKNGSVESDSWEKELQKVYSTDVKRIGTLDGRNIYTLEYGITAIKSFIKDLLKKQKKELRKEILKEMEMHEGVLGTGQIACRNILKLLK